MKRYTPALAAALVGLAAPLAAQGTIVYPLANANREGLTGTDAPFGSSATARMQEILREAKGRQHAVKRLAYRRDGAINSPNAVARTVDVEVFVGPGSWATFGDTFARNWAAAPTRTINRKQIALPDWSRRPATPPASFDALLPFDVQYAHNGASELVVEVVMYANTQAAAGYPDDVDGAGSYTYGSSLALGAGCKTSTSPPGQAFSQGVSFRSSGQDSEVSLATVFAPPSTAVATLFGTRDPNQAIAGLCTRLRSNALVTVPVGTSDPQGFLVALDLPVGAWQGAWASVKLYTQAAALDATQPGIKIALSEGTEVTLPAAVPWAPYTVYSLYASSLTAARGSLAFLGPVVQIGT